MMLPLPSRSRNRIASRCRASTPVCSVSTATVLTWAPIRRACFARISSSGNCVVTPRGEPSSTIRASSPAARNPTFTASGLPVASITTGEWRRAYLFHIGVDQESSTRHGGMLFPAPRRGDHRCALGAGGHCQPLCEQSDRPGAYNREMSVRRQSREGHTLAADDTQHDQRGSLEARAARHLEHGACVHRDDRRVRRAHDCDGVSNLHAGHVGADRYHHTGGRIAHPLGQPQLRVRQPHELRTLRPRAHGTALHPHGHRPVPCARDLHWDEFGLPVR